MTTYYGSLVETSGASNANSYASLAEADDYHDGIPATNTIDWTGATDENKEDALMWATRLLDSWVTWHGIKADTAKTDGIPDQRLEWPRENVQGPNGEDLDSDLIPQFLKEAAAEFARQLLIKDLTKEPLRGFNRIRAGDITIDFDTVRSKRVLLKSVRALIWRHGDIQEGKFSREVVRV